jgi:hypothetical protein
MLGRTVLFFAAIGVTIAVGALVYLAMAPALRWRLRSRQQVQ